MNAIDRRANLLTLVRHGAFLTLLCLYLRYWVTPAIHFEAHPHSPVFYSNVAYLKEFLSYPGGLVYYLAGFVALAYHWPWGGPLVLTAMVGLVCWATDVLILAMGGKLRELAFGPAILLVVALNGLMDHPIALVALLAALLSLALYLALPAGSDGARIGVFLAVGALLHYVAGSAFLLFALLAGLHELLVRRRRLPTLVALLSMEAIPYLGATYLFSTALVDAYRRWSPWDPTIGPRYPLAACFLYFPLLVVGLSLWQWIASRRSRAPAEPLRRSKSRRARPKAAPATSRATAPHVRSLAGTAAILIVAVVTALGTFDANVHRVLTVDDCARRSDWEGVLRAARRLPMLYYTDLVNQHVNQALYETGRLGDEMFAYPQTPLWLIVDLDLGASPEEQGLKMQHRADLWFQLGDLDLRLGLVNEAEHEAHEALAMHGPHPEILKRLALVNLIKQQPDAARVFLKALLANPVYAPWAADRLQRMARDPSLSSDPYIRRVQALQCRRDRRLPRHELHLRCRGLLTDNPRNRMAFEYFMASCLLRKDLAGFVRELPRLEALGYRELPRHYQEALLVYERETRTIVDRGDYAIAPEVLQRFADFSQAAGRDPTALADRFGDSYFFYRAFGVTGSMVPR